MIADAKLSLGSAYRERVVAELLAPTLADLQANHPAAYFAYLIAAYCPPDVIPVPWLRAILIAHNADWEKKTKHVSR